jgi:hypothetical protein
MAAKNPRPSKISWAGATRDIVLRLIGTGQLPIGIFGAAILLMIWKTPSEQMGEVWAVLRLFIEARSGMGYSLAGVVSVGWFVHAKFQRRNAESELRRLSASRTKKQEESLGGELESSED